MGWLAACYFASAEFRALDPRSQWTRRLVLEDCLREPRKPGSADLMRDCPVSSLMPAHVKMLRDRKASKPGAGNNRRKYISSMFGWAVENGLMRSNPAREVRRIRYASIGFHTWTVEEVRQLEQRHPIGTRARLALALLLFLGVRRGDVVALGRQHVKDGWLRMVPKKRAISAWSPPRSPSCRCSPTSSPAVRPVTSPTWSPSTAKPLRRTDSVIGFGRAAIKRRCITAPRMVFAKRAQRLLPRMGPPIANSWRYMTGVRRNRLTFIRRQPIKNVSLPMLQSSSSVIRP